MTTLKQHILSSYFPKMTASEFKAIKDSIQAIGVQSPVTLYEGQIIDGWHRYTAANELGVHCPTVELDSSIDPMEFSLAQVARRNMTAGVSAITVTLITNWRGPGNTSKAAGPAAFGSTTQQMADSAGVGSRSIRQAKEVIQNGDASVIQAVKSGEIGLEKAAAISKLPKKDQEAAISKPAPKKEKPKKADAPAANPSPEPAAPEQDKEAPDDDEVNASIMAAAADITAFQILLDADDKLATAYSEIKRLNSELAAMTISRNGEMAKCHEAIAMVKKLQRQLTKYQKG